MPENLENSAVATGLENASFNSNLKERQCQRIFKLPSDAHINNNNNNDSIYIVTLLIEIAVLLFCSH